MKPWCIEKGVTWYPEADIFRGDNWNVVVVVGPLSECCCSFVVQQERGRTYEQVYFFVHSIQESVMWVVIIKFLTTVTITHSKGPVKIYRIPRPGFGKNLPPFFSRKKIFAPLIFFEKTLSPLFFSKKCLRPLSMVPAWVPGKFWPVPKIKFWPIIQPNENHKSTSLVFLFCMFGAKMESFGLNLSHISYTEMWVLSKIDD